LPLCREVRDVLLQSGVTLIYGESGVGKTTLALEVLREACTSRCLYVSTERLDFLRRAAQMGLDIGKLVVYDTFDPNDYVELVAFKRLFTYDVIVVDSINSFLYEGAAAYTLTGLLASTLHTIAERYGAIVVETAQVRWRPEQGARPSGEKALELWADRTVALSYGAGGRRLARIGGKEYEYLIRGEGIVWLNC